MSNLKRFLLLLSLLALFASCRDGYRQRTENYLTIGTFNIEWLGDNINDRNERTDVDYRLIAEIINNTGADILALQEIENENALDIIMQYLPEFSYFLGKEGRQQNVGVIFKKTISAKFIEEYMPLAIEPKRNRPGLIAEFKVGKFEFIIMSVHFKSTSRFDDTQEKLEHSRTTRLKQAEVVSQWADSVLKAGKHRNLIILGDLNDTPIRKKFNTLYPIVNNKNLVFLTDSLKSCKYRTMYAIDHIVVSKAAKERVLPGSAGMFDFRSSYDKTAAKKISDHCPVLVRFNIK